MGPTGLRALPQMGLMQAPVGVIMLDAELRVVWVNAAAERLSAGRPGGGPGGGWARCCPAWTRT